MATFGGDPGRIECIALWQRCMAGVEMLSRYRAVDSGWEALLQESVDLYRNVEGDLSLRWWLVSVWISAS